MLAAQSSGCDKNILYERVALNEELGDIFKAIKIYTILLKLYPNYDILLHILILCECNQSYAKAINIFEYFYDTLPSKNKIESIVFLYGFYINHKKYKNGYLFYKNKISQSKDPYIIEMISNNYLFKLNKLFCFLYLSTNIFNDINENLNKDEIIKEISNEFNFLISNKNEADLEKIGLEII